MMVFYMRGGGAIYLCSGLEISRKHEWDLKYGTQLKWKNANPSRYLFLKKWVAPSFIQSPIQAQVQSKHIAVSTIAFKASQELPDP
jgi:hypothetical protein